jgi:hypothetical protein
VRAKPLIAHVSALTLCAACSGVDARLDPPPAALVVPCALPQRLLVRALTEAEVVVHWRRDRTALTDCVARHAALAEWGQAVAGSR